MVIIRRTQLKLTQGAEASGHSDARVDRRTGTGERVDTVHICKIDIVSVEVI